MEGGDYLASDVTGLRLKTAFTGAYARKAIAEGRAEYLPWRLFHAPRLFLRHFQPDVALVQLSEMDRRGVHSLGVEVACKRVIGATPVIIAEVNPQMPHTFGDTRIGNSRLNDLVPVNYQIHQMSTDANNPETGQIAKNVAELVPDQATIQIGIGAIPDAVVRELRYHKDLGLHTEVLSTQILDLVESGALTGAFKKNHVGKMVATILLGTDPLYRFVHNNPDFEMYPAEITNDPALVAQEERFFAINGALHVDLTGQVNACSLGQRMVSGVGGQLDMMEGAAFSHSGMPIIAMPSTATVKGDRRSRIVCSLPEGSGVTTPRYVGVTVVTEFGHAVLEGLSARERAKALIGIAHPEHQEILRKQAKDVGLL